MLHKRFFTSLFVALFAMLIGVSSSFAQDMGKPEMMKKQDKMKCQMAAVDVMKADENGDGKVYACSMGCAVTDEAGRCPKCEMKMQEMSVDDAAQMLKDKGLKVVDRTAMKKGCGSDCQKPCCAKTDEAVSDANAWNKVCPVMGNDVSPEGPTVEYNGKVYGFCCPKCVGKFNSDPEKYSKNLSEDGKEFAASSM